MADPDIITSNLLEHAAEIAGKARASAVLVYADVFRDHAAVRRFAKSCSSVPVVFATRTVDAFLEQDRGDWSVIRVPNVHLTRLGQIKIALLLGLAEGRFTRGDTVVCLSGMADSGVLDTIVVMEVGDEFEMLAAADTERLSEHVRPDVFTRVLDIAIALGNEGREGKPVGTAFILGDTENVLPHVRQMILNPFKGYSGTERNVLAPELTETVKEFAALDGAFVIRGDGVIEAAGVYLSPGLRGAALPPGLGSRHNSAAGITGATKATAIVVSESTGNVSILRDGNIVMEIERPRPIGTVCREDVPRAGESAFSSRNPED
jgi:DNA integrity scanning protein DisA with diadenylate cyclase activity